MTVTTLLGPMEESLLEKKSGIDENDNERVEWTEYYFEGDLVHRSAHITLKQAGVTASLLAGSF